MQNQRPPRLAFSFLAGLFQRLPPRLGRLRSVAEVARAAEVVALAAGEAGAGVEESQERQDQARPCPVQAESLHQQTGRQ